MDCRETSLLITLRLDGAISKDEEAALAAHLAGCKACTRELALQERLSGALREIGREAVQAPPELCGLVMSRLRAERRTAFALLPAAWRRVMAAAAAVLIIAGGSAGVTAGLKMAGGGKMIGLETPAKVDVATGGGTTNGDGYSNQGNPVKPPGGVNSQSDVQGENVPDNNEVSNTGTPATAGNGTGDVKPGANGGNTSPPGTPSVTTEGPRALLSSNMKVTSTVLKVAVDDLAEARAKAVALAAGASAATQVFPEQGGGKKIVVIRITVESGQAPALIAGLTKLGTLADRQDESRDITSLYNETMVQYSDLQSRLSSAKDAAERQQLEVQAASYKRQLDAWEAEAGKRVIMLWLEGS